MCARGTRGSRISKSWSPSPCPPTDQTATSASYTPTTRRPKRRLHEVLKEQGWQENQAITFLTDGGDTVREHGAIHGPGV